MSPKLWTDYARKVDKATAVVWSACNLINPFPQATLKIRPWFSLVDPSSPAAQKYAAEAADWVIGGGSGMVLIEKVNHVPPPQSNSDNAPAQDLKLSS
ncbi:hypothetical protein C8R41DRAFT_923723 [Lentinula lateritia]|uniref:Uncharacterized protein n=1 Tax=Lentinula lateritia TaxID=40482 RepID=A0ABQ8V5E2_9AGAR|nr:hypothetical protein C8R41DRAFT_923723 [Lentinula lateritia]